MLCFISDIDECSKNGSVCDENAECFNNDGSFTCICKDGYTGNGTVCLGELPLGKYNATLCLVLLLLLWFVVIVIVFW